MSRRRILLADDHAATVRSWRTLLEPEFDVVGVVSNGHELVDAVDRLAPDVVVTDIEMPGMTGIAAASAILQRHPAARIVFATVHADRTMLEKGLAIGALGYVLKARAGDDLVPAIRAALRGARHISVFPAAQGRADCV
jgi:DNA-binding NarL/FixJ family response regulator